MTETVREYYLRFGEARFNYVETCKTLARTLEEDDCDETQTMLDGVVLLTKYALDAQAAKAGEEAAREMLEKLKGKSKK